MQTVAVYLFMIVKRYLLFDNSFDLEDTSLEPLIADTVKGDNRQCKERLCNGDGVSLILELLESSFVMRMRLNILYIGMSIVDLGSCSIEFYRCFRIFLWIFVSCILICLMGISNRY